MTNPGCKTHRHGRTALPGCPLPSFLSAPGREQHPTALPRRAAHVHTHTDTHTQGRTHGRTPAPSLTPHSHTRRPPRTGSRRAGSAQPRAPPKVTAPRTARAAQRPQVRDARRKEGGRRAAGAGLAARRGPGSTGRRGPGTPALPAAPPDRLAPPVCWGRSWPGPPQLRGRSRIIRDRSLRPQRSLPPPSPSLPTPPPAAEKGMELAGAYKSP